MAAPETTAPTAPSPHQDEFWMRQALELARQAGAAGEIPVGAVLVAGGRAVGRGRNSSVGRNDPTAHAEILALRAAGSELRNYRLTGTTIYATVEPCLMCLGALLHARVDRLVFGAPDPKLGGTARLDRLRDVPGRFNHRFGIEPGVLADEAAALLLDFFRRRRQAPARRSAIRGEVPKWS